ncbi:guanylate kinase [Lactobacillus sp. Marseille-P7033]|nr:guanylate kinase [Lactobacillus sp. Marseille-P7033]NGC77654.1 guanylate kinase [Limosilactobacillus reuteri]
MKRNNYVFVVTGAAGSGKTTVANYLQENYGMQRVITHTTRLPRADEKDGVDYHFETPASMKKLHLLEEVKYDQFQYGSSFESLEEGWKNGHNDVIVLDTAGAITYHQKLGSKAVIIFLTVTHMDALAKRMTLRGDKISAIRSRLHSKEYHRDLALPDALKGTAHVVVNDQWKKTKEQVDAIVKQMLSK